MRARQRTGGGAPAVAAVVAALALLAAGCGGKPPQTYDAGRSLASLVAGGWKADRAPGMPDTLAGVRQVDYLETSAPDGRRIDLQFLESPAAAARERDAAAARTKGFRGTVAGNVVVLPVPATTAAPGDDLAYLKSLLRTGRRARPRD
ncbi:MAG: hypothetical protein LC685_03300 [Actinobacteria bacterium]|nr:hypothetical protein [Actinomycetota bacterium]